MKRKLISIMALSIASLCVSAQVKPSLTFDGINGYPSEGQKFRIELFTYPDGLISRIVSYSGDPAKEDVDTEFKRIGKKIVGENSSDGYLTRIEIEPGPKTMQITKTETEIATKKKTPRKKTVRIAPNKETLFEDDERVYRRGANIELEILDKKTKESIYLFSKNQIVNEGYYRADWAKNGNQMSIKTYLTMEQYGAWIDAGSGVFSGKTLTTADPSLNIINFYIIESSYPGIPDFLPFLLGLKTGTY